MSGPTPNSGVHLPRSNRWRAGRWQGTTPAEHRVRPRTEAERLGRGRRRVPVAVERPGCAMDLKITERRWWFIVDLLAGQATFCCFGRQRRRWRVEVNQRRMPTDFKLYGGAATK